jgi:hypothetical protein
MARSLQVEARQQRLADVGLKFQVRFDRPAASADSRAVWRNWDRYLPERAADRGGARDLVLQGDAAGRRVFLSRNRVPLN